MTTSDSKPSAKSAKAYNAVRAFALAYPETHEDFPWGHSALKVKGKAFVFMGADASGFSLSVKLTHSNWMALQFPFCEPTHYGLGKHGWVSATFGPTETAPMDMILDWVKESFLNVAPKTLVKNMLAATTSATSTKKSANPSKTSASKSKAVTTKKVVTKSATKKATKSTTKKPTKKAPSKAPAKATAKKVSRKKAV